MSLPLPNRIPDGKIRFGLNAATQFTTFPPYQRLAQHAESGGYDSFWVWDHFIPGPAVVQGNSLECFTMLAAIAATTKSITLGSLVLGVTYRNPAMTAKLATMIDHISEGRLVLGTGAAWYQREHEMYGIPFPPPGERVRREEEMLQIVRQMWTQDETTFQGRYYQTVGAFNDPKPTQQPHPPILVGTRGDKGLRIVARHADMHNTAGVPESAAEIYGRLEIACEEVGRDPKTIEKTAIILQAVGDDKATVDQKKEALQKVFNTDWESLKPRVLHGTPDDVIARIRDYTALGITHFMFSQFDPFDLDGLDWMAEKVFPAFR